MRGTSSGSNPWAGSSFDDLTRRRRLPAERVERADIGRASRSSIDATFDVLQEAVARRRALEAERAAAAQRQREEVGRLIAQQAFGEAAPLLAHLLQDFPTDAELLAWEAEVAPTRSADAGTDES
jgi:hypothetical protein